LAGARQESSVDGNILRAAFNLPTKVKPSVEGVELPDSGYAVVVVSKIEPGVLKKATVDQNNLYRNSIAKSYAQADYNLYTAGAKDQAKVKMK